MNIADLKIDRTLRERGHAGGAALLERPFDDGVRGRGGKLIGAPGQKQKAEAESNRAKDNRNAIHRHRARLALRWVERE